MLHFSDKSDIILFLWFLFNFKIFLFQKQIVYSSFKQAIPASIGASVRLHKIMRSLKSISLKALCNTWRMALTVNILHGSWIFSLIDQLIMNTTPIRYLTYLALIQIRSRSCQDEELSTPTKQFNETPSGLWHFSNRKLKVSVQGIMKEKLQLGWQCLNPK